MVAGGRLQFEFLPVSDAETIIVELDLPIGTSLDETEAIVSAHRGCRREPAGDDVGLDDRSACRRASMTRAASRTRGLGTHLGQLFVELLPTEAARSRVVARHPSRFASDVGTIGARRRARRVLGDPGRWPAGKDITMFIDRPARTRRDARRRGRCVHGAAREMDGVFDITDDDAVGQREVAGRAEARRRGARTHVGAAVARQVRGALYGLDAHVYSAHQEDIDVRVRLAETSRRSLHEIENLWIIAPGGTPVPLVEIAELTEGNSYNTIKRVDRRRAIHVTADVPRRTRVPK